MKENNLFSAFVGIDWADTKHDISTVSAIGGKPEHQVISHTPNTLTDWAHKLRQLYPKGKIAVCLEQTKGALIYHLLGYDFFTLFPVNPKSLARFREAFNSSGSKSDFSDADYLRELIYSHHNRLRPWLPDEEITRTIGFLAEGRRKAVNERTKQIQRLRAALKMYYPQALDLAGDNLSSKMALDLLQKWPQLDAIKKAKPATIKKFYYTHNSRSSSLLEQRLTAIREAVAMTNDKAVLISSIVAVKMLVGQISQLNDSVDEYNQEIKSLYDDHQDKDIFDSFPGSGPTLGPRLLSAWGSDRARYESAEDMQKYSGSAPVTKASGKSKTVIRRRACPKFLLQTFHEFANCSRKASIWAQAYYEMLRERGKSHNTAVRALAFKWIRIMFRCWKDRTKYDEVKYLRALQQSNSPLRKYI